MQTLTVEIIPDGRLSKNGLRRSNWRTSQALVKQAREDAFILGRAEMDADWQTPEHASVRIVHYYARRPLDFDGLACIVAPTIDGLVDAGVLWDDDPGHITDYHLQHVKVKTLAENRVTVTVTSISG